MAITKNSSTYWEGKADAESLQRIYGISFPDSKQMKEWKVFQVRRVFSSVERKTDSRRLLLGEKDGNKATHVLYCSF